MRPGRLTVCVESRVKAGICCPAACTVIGGIPSLGLAVLPPYAHTSLLVRPAGHHAGGARCLPGLAADQRLASSYGCCCCWWCMQCCNALSCTGTAIWGARPPVK